MEFRVSSGRDGHHLALALIYLLKRLTVVRCRRRSDLEEITFCLAFVHLPARHQPYQVSGRGIPESWARYSLHYLPLLVLRFFPNKVEKHNSLPPLKKTNTHSSGLEYFRPILNGPFSPKSSQIIIAMNNQGHFFFLKYQIFVPTKAQRQLSSKPLVIYCC